MTAKDFIIERLKMISSKIKDVSLRYAFDVRSNFHIVEVSPDGIYSNDGEYRLLESDVEMEFMSKFPDEDILFSERSDLNDMTNLIFEISPCVMSFRFDSVFDSSVTLGDDSYAFDIDNKLRVMENNYCLAA